VNNQDALIYLIGIIDGIFCPPANTIPEGHHYIRIIHNGAVPDMVPPGMVGGSFVGFEFWKEYLFG